MSVSRSRRRLCHILLDPNLPGRILIQPAQICLPSHSDDAKKQRPELRPHVDETERADCGPEFEAVDDACRHGFLQPLQRVGYSGAGEERLHAEEVGVEDRGEGHLLDEDFDGHGEDF